MEQPQQKLMMQPQQSHDPAFVHTHQASQQANMSQYASQAYHPQYTAEMQANQTDVHDSLGHQEEQFASQHIGAQWSGAGPEASHKFSVQADYAAASSMWNSTAQLQNNANTRQYSQSVSQEHCMRVVDYSQGYNNSSGDISQALMACEQPCSFEALQYAEPQDMPQEPPLQSHDCHAEHELMLASELTRQDGQVFWHQPSLPPPGERHFHTVDNPVVSTDCISNQIPPEDSACAPQQSRKCSAVGTLPLKHASSIQISQAQAQSDEMQSNQHQLDTYINSEAPYLPKHPIQLQSSQHQYDSQTTAAANAGQAGAAAHTSLSDEPERFVIIPKPAIAAQRVSRNFETHKAGSADLPSRVPAGQIQQAQSNSKVAADQVAIAVGRDQQAWKRAKRVSNRKHLKALYSHS